VSIGPRALVTLFVMALLMAVVPTSSAARPVKMHYCGEVGGNPAAVYAHGVQCAKAKSLVLNTFEMSCRADRATCHTDGWLCRTRNHGISSRTTCTKPKPFRKIVFSTSA
jgi:hypothetical protein